MVEEDRKLISQMNTSLAVLAERLSGHMEREEEMFRQMKESANHDRESITRAHSRIDNIRTLNVALSGAIAVIGAWLGIKN